MERSSKTAIDKKRVLGWFGVQTSERGRRGCFYVPSAYNLKKTSSNRGKLVARKMFGGTVGLYGDPTQLCKELPHYRGPVRSVRCRKRTLRDAKGMRNRAQAVDYAISRVVAYGKAYAADMALGAAALMTVGGPVGPIVSFGLMAYRAMRDIQREGNGGTCARCTLRSDNLAEPLGWCERGVAYKTRAEAEAEKGKGCAAAAGARGDAKRAESPSAASRVVATTTHEDSCLVVRRIGEIIDVAPQLDAPGACRRRARPHASGVAPASAPVWGGTLAPASASALSAQRGMPARKRSVETRNAM